MAGMAALAKQLNPDSSAVEVADYLRSNAEDFGEEGPDYAWGYGFAVLPAADAPYDPCIEDLGEIDDSGETEVRGNAWISICKSDRPD